MSIPEEVKFFQNEKSVNNFARLINRTIVFL